MRVIAIQNPIAGAHADHAPLRSLFGRLTAMGVWTQIWHTRCRGDGITLAKEAVKEATKKKDAVDSASPTNLASPTNPASPRNGVFVMAIGGDGTVREVAEGLVGTGVPMLIWPRGTENLVAKSLGYRADPQLIASCLTAGRTTALDVGVVNGRNFLVVAGVGFDAECVQRLVNNRNGHITHLSYTAPIWRTIWGHRFPPIRVICGDQFVWEGRGMVFVGNMNRYSSGLPVVRDAIPDDGRLDLVILPCSNPAQWLMQAIRIALARHVEHRNTRYLRCTKLRIEPGTPTIPTVTAAAIPVEIDGDYFGSLPLDIEIHPRALSFRLPPV